MLQFIKSSHVYPKPGYDNAHYYTMQITASQFLDKLCDTSASVAINCISVTVQESAADAVKPARRESMPKLLQFDVSSNRKTVRGYTFTSSAN